MARSFVSWWKIAQECSIETNVQKWTQTEKGKVNTIIHANAAELGPRKWFFRNRWRIIGVVLPSYLGEGASTLCRTINIYWMRKSANSNYSLGSLDAFLFAKRYIQFRERHTSELRIEPITTQRWEAMLQRRPMTATLRNWDALTTWNTRKAAVSTIEKEKSGHQVWQPYCVNYPNP